ncbi:WD40-repeat-containing domain protein [Melampsora americana]|nr:WD40-repeat-containing domain protein [Melampsora americana]
MSLPPIHSSDQQPSDLSSDEPPLSSELLTGLPHMIVYDESDESGSALPHVVVLYEYPAMMRAWAEDEEEMDENEDEDGIEDRSETYYFDEPDGARVARYYPEVTQPVSEGLNLDRSGEYSKPPDHYHASMKRLKDYSQNLVDVMASAEGSYRPFDKRKLDGTFFYTCAQGYRVYIYDMTVPPQKFEKNVSDPFNDRNPSHFSSESSHVSSIKLIRTFQAPAHNCRWTITDANLSPDNNWMAYSSITPIVHLVKTRGEDAVLGLGLEDHEQEALHFGLENWERRSFGIWSLRFSSDGKELIAGGSSGRIIAYDVERKTCLLNVVGHSDDTNALCFADKTDPNILVSGSDDTYAKIWDRRSLQNAQPAGVLVGHTEGLTFVSAKGDGRYIVSNGKDQGAKLWDLRKMISGEKFDEMDKLDVSIRGWDYRHGVYDRPRYREHPDDCSVMTYRGHSVLQTLIRVHFSPPNTTGQRYIASGSSDGFVHIWNLDGTIAQIINRSQASPLFKSDETKNKSSLRSEFTNPFDVPNPMNQSHRNLRRHRLYGYDSMTVRDLSWNPNEPSLISTAWGGNDGAIGSLALHPFMSDDKRLKLGYEDD